jgi:hypothetical protein
MSFDNKNASSYREDQNIRNNGGAQSEGGTTLNKFKDIDSRRTDFLETARQAFEEATTNPEIQGFMQMEQAEQNE